MIDSGVMPVLVAVRATEGGFEQGHYGQLTGTAQGESAIAFVFDDGMTWACAELTDYPVYGWEPGDDDGGAAVDADAGA